MRKRSTPAHAATRSRFIRVEDLVFAAAEAFPGLTPDARRDRGRERHASARQGRARDRSGPASLSHSRRKRSGRHLCHAMLLPRPESQEHLQKFIADGALDLGAVGSSAAASPPSHRRQSALPQRRGSRRRSTRWRSRSTSRSSIRRPKSPSCAAARSITRNIAASAFSAPAST